MSGAEEAMKARQLPLPLRLRQGNGFSSLLAGQNAELLDLLQDCASGREGQLYLWGERGCGRTHMLEAVVSRALEAGLCACLLPGRELAGLPVAVLEGMEAHDVIAVDDLDLLIKQPAWQEALFHLYNRARAHGAALIFTAQAPPRALELDLPDLATRLAAGGVYRVHPLGEEDLIKLLRHRAAQRGLVLEEDVARYIVHRSERSAAALTQHLERLDREALVQKRRLTLPFVKQVLGW